MADIQNDAILWALVCAAYHLEKVPPEAQTDLEHIRGLLGMYRPKTVSLYFLKAALAFDPPRSLEAAEALYEYHGVPTDGLEKAYPSAKPQ